jgi:hypothetical protein
LATAKPIILLPHLYMFGQNSERFLSPLTLASSREVSDPKLEKDVVVGGLKPPQQYDVAKCYGWLS